MMVLAVMFLLPFAVMAGSLDPSAPPEDGTMHSLEDIYNAVTGNCPEPGCAACEGVPVARTGQTASYYTGDDGEHQKGIAGPSPRFTVNSDNCTVTDNLTGLIWLQDANYIQTTYPEYDADATAGDGRVTWQHALDFVEKLNDGTYTACGGGYTDWRLPNIKELQSLTDFGNHTPALPSGHLFMNVQSYNYWSGTSCALNIDGVWSVSMVNGGVNCYYKSYFYYVWPVRGGND
ncbi:MAG: DUF1566 domain-containing protein [Deltaproteobacteria bacterium]|nr:DUF1566 domain-containing protein [Deltaproteobacteria bacterium]